MNKGSSAANGFYFNRASVFFKNFSDSMTREKFNIYETEEN